MLCVSSTIWSDEPNHFNEAWNHHSLNDSKKWRVAITKALYCMEYKNIWTATRKTDVPKDKRLIRCKWDFKTKRDGTYRARLVALGYSQVPGVDFTDHLALRVNDVNSELH